LVVGVPEELGYLLGVVRSHNRWRGFECVNLIASENVMSPLAKSLYLSDMMHRYAEGRPGKRFYQGTKFVDDVEVFVSRLLSELLSVRFVGSNLVGEGVDIVTLSFRKTFSGP
jgi:glycine hydroxymethyltransferase